VQNQNRYQAVSGTEHSAGYCHFSISRVKAIGKNCKPGHKGQKRGRLPKGHTVFSDLCSAGGGRAKALLTASHPNRFTQKAGEA